MVDASRQPFTTGGHGWPVSPGALSRIKHDPHEHLPPQRIESACRDAGHRWRERKLGPVLTLQLFVLQVLHGNTAIRHLRHLVGAPLNAAAYCRARMRLPLAAVRRLVRDGDGAAALRSELAAEAGGDALVTWRGHRAHLVDGTGTIAPDEPPRRRAFGQPTGRRSGCGLPVPKVLGLFDAMTGLLVEATRLRPVRARAGAGVAAAPAAASRRPARRRPRVPLVRAPGTAGPSAACRACSACTRAGSSTSARAARLSTAARAGRGAAQHAAGQAAVAVRAAARQARPARRVAQAP